MVETQVLQIVEAQIRALVVEALALLVIEARALLPKTVRRRRAARRDGLSMETAFGWRRKSVPSNRIGSSIGCSRRA